MGSGNPAGRLLGIVEEARGLGDNLGIRDAWLKILNVENGDHAQLMYRIGKVMQLPGQTMDALYAVDPDRVSHQRHWLIPVEKAFLVGMTGSNGTTKKWNAVKSHFNDQTVGFLDMASALLERAGWGRAIPEEQLQALRSKLEEVLDELAATNLSDQARGLVRRNITSALRALDEYKISGEQGIEEAAHQAVGELAFNPEIGEEVSKTSVGKKFAGVLLFIFATIGALSDLDQLAGRAPALLTDMRGGEEQVADHYDGGEEDVTDYEEIGEEDAIKK